MKKILLLTGVLLSLGLFCACSNDYDDDVTDSGLWRFWDTRCSTCCTGSDVYDWRNTVMIYSRGTPGNGVWHCPFPPEWVEKMKHAGSLNPIAVG